MPHIEGDPTKPTPDIGLRGLALLDFIIKHAEEHPETFDMKAWAIVHGPDITWDWSVDDGAPTACGTAMCVAGWAAHLVGAQLMYMAAPNPQLYTRSDDQHMVRTADLVLAADYARVPSHIEYVPSYYEGYSVNGKVPISHLAAHVLGLSMADAINLFDSTNTLDDVKRIRDTYVAEGAWSVDAPAEA